MLTLSARFARPIHGTLPLGPSPGLTESRQAVPNLGSVTLGRRPFRLIERSQDFEEVLRGISGQQIVVRFTAVVLSGNLCAVANFQAFGLAKPEPGRPFGAGSTLLSNPTGFSLELGQQQVSRVVSAISETGTVDYVLSFDAVRVFGG
ncbi:MAG TPA: hypothetical protein VGD78_22265 [Chthoniobacterales bacterium]